MPSPLAGLSDRAACEALLPVDVLVLVELVRVHEPLVAFVVVPVVARLVALCANSKLAGSITSKIESMVFFKPPPLRVSEDLGEER